LLKDKAARCLGEARTSLYRKAAAAYSAAADLQSATYPLINAATLRLLAGDGAQAAVSAAAVLRRIEQEPDEPETPYYRLATRAEALLLLDRYEDAQAAFADAVALAPRAWEDHASTLRQFRLILDAQGRDAAWLDAHRPPRSLHFGGHMSFDSAIIQREHLDETIAAALDEEQVGFGYGALAAGADIIIAEALLARGAELHAVLPGGVDAFAAVSVDPFGPEWRRRFDALLERAETVRPVRPLGAVPGPTMIGLADEIAIGAAAMNARRLESEAVQLLVLDTRPGVGAGAATARARAIWARGDRRQRLIEAPREAVEAAPAGSERRPEDNRPLAVLAVRLAEEEAPIAERLAALRASIAAAGPPPVGPYWAGGQVLLAYDGPGAAARTAAALAGQGYRVGGHYLAAAPFRDPFSGAERLPEACTGAAEAAAASTPPGSVCVTEDFAAALVARGGEAPRCEYVGELDPPDAGPPVGLYALK
jgi:hypothetical protein